MAEQLSTEQFPGIIAPYCDLVKLNGVLAEHYRGDIFTWLLLAIYLRDIIMNTTAPSYKLTRNGVFRIDDDGSTKRKVAEPLYLKGIGCRNSDGHSFAQIRFRTIHKNWHTELAELSCLIPEKRRELKARLADLGYQWPERTEISNAILKALGNKRSVRKAKRLKIVAVPGWHGPAIVRPGRVFAPADHETEYVIHPDTPAHLGVYTQGQGCLKDWQERVAEPSRKSSRLRLGIAAALAATFLRPSA